MSETLCTLRTKGGGGGRYTETSLWTNSAPTSNFADQNVTLSDSITNYKYIAIRIRFSTTESASATTIVSTSDFVTMTNTTTSGHPLCFVGGRYSNVYERAVYYVDATTVKFGSSFQQNSTSVSNGTVIPLEILGLNELDHGTVTTIPEVRFSSVNTSGRCFGYIYLDLSKYKSMTYTLVISNASFGSGQYIRVDNNGTSVQEMGKTAGTYTINFDSSWTGDDYRLAVIATPSSAYGYVSLSNIIFTLKDN